MIDEEFAGGEMDRMQGGWDAAKAAVDGLRWEVAKLAAGDEARQGHVGRLQDEIDGLCLTVAELRAEVERLNGDLADERANFETWTAEYRRIAKERDEATAAAEALEQRQERHVAEIDGLLTWVAGLEKERDEAGVNALAKLEADIRRRTARTDAEQDVIWRAYKWRAALTWHTGVSRDDYANGLADTQEALIAAVDALDGPSGAASNPVDGGELDLLRAQREAILGLLGPGNRPVMSRLIKRIYASPSISNEPIHALGEPAYFDCNPPDETGSHVDPTSSQTWEQRVANLMAWCAQHLGNSFIHRKIRELLAVHDDAYPWQTERAADECEVDRG